ncbi:hypothetical protein ACHQM5_028921 [Ranunculus cassubicifolius]
MSIIPSFFNNRASSSIFDPFSLDIFDPFQAFPSQNHSNFPQETSAMASARIDRKETPTAHKEEIKVEVEEGKILQISGERNKDVEEKNDTWHRVERSSGKFVRRFRLPGNAKVDQVKAAMENGVLTVTVPEDETEKKADVNPGSYFFGKGSH